jgi:hypothetical protein
LQARPNDIGAKLGLAQSYLTWACLMKRPRCSAMSSTRGKATSCRRAAPMSMIAMGHVSLAGRQLGAAVQALLRGRHRMDWWDLSRPEHELLQPLPIGAFRIERAVTRQVH